MPQGCSFGANHEEWLSLDNTGKRTPINPMSMEIPVPITPGQMESSARTTPPSAEQKLGTMDKMKKVR